MSEYLTEMGDTGLEPGVTWNSTKIPGTCKPSDFATLAKFKAFQEQLNRVAQVKGYPKIAVDGDIGPGTVALALKVTGSNTAASSCATIAGNITALTTAVMAVANTLSAPAKVSGPAPVTPPSIVNAAGQIQVAPPGAGNSIGASIYDTFDKLGTVGKLAAVGILGGIGYFVIVKKKRRK
jgi:hypothetical protein